MNRFSSYISPVFTTLVVGSFLVSAIWAGKAAISKQSRVMQTEIEFQGEEDWMFERSTGEVKYMSASLQVCPLMER